MTTIYRHYIESHEAEGMFSLDGTLIDAWSCNDANWRNEYFGTFMKAVGVIVMPLPKQLKEPADRAICAHFGWDYEENS